MALPLIIRNNLDALYDKLSAVVKGMDYVKVVVGESQYKIRMTRNTIDDKKHYIIEIIEK